MVLFKLIPAAATITQVDLYIPIWFYSNKVEEPGTHICCTSFTFQYGSIQIQLFSFLKNL